MIIPRPFDPNELIQRVAVFSGRSETGGPTPGDAPLEGGGLDDDLLDQALGLDRIDVTSSEVMDKTMRVKRQAGKTSEKMVGLDHDVSGDDDTGETGRVESLMIRDESSDIRHDPTDPPKQEKPVTGTSKLEIMSDQYGLSDPGSFRELKNESQTHDYDWFVNSMREDVQSPGGTPPADTPDQGLDIADPSSHVDPVTPGPKMVQAPGAAPEPKARTSGVDKFIDEFKHEIENLRDSEPEGAGVQTQTVPAEGHDKELAWEDKLERITPEHMAVFRREFVSVLAEKIAEKIVSKIDPEKLLQLIKQEIINQSRK